MFDVSAVGYHTGALAALEQLGIKTASYPAGTFGYPITHAHDMLAAAEASLARTPRAMGALSSVPGMTMPTTEHLAKLHALGIRPNLRPLERLGPAVETTMMKSLGLPG